MQLADFWFRTGLANDDSLYGYELLSLLFKCSKTLLFTFLFMQTTFFVSSIHYFGMLTKKWKSTWCSDVASGTFFPLTHLVSWLSPWLQNLLNLTMYSDNSFISPCVRSSLDLQSLLCWMVSRINCHRKSHQMDHSFGSGFCWTNFTLHHFGRFIM